MRAAFKEWAIVVDALGRGEQIIILRKGGISEGRGGFKMEHQRFWLFATRFHQQRESVTAAAQRRFDQIAPLFPASNVVRLEYFAEAVDAIKLGSLEAVEALRGQHIWRDELIGSRFDWGRDKAVYALAVRVFRLAKAIELPMRDEYGGCKSWIELERDVETGNAAPVLADEEFALKLRNFRSALEASVAGSDPAGLPMRPPRAEPNPLHSHPIGGGQ
jgi:hypothetical protein